MIFTNLIETNLRTKELGKQIEYYQRIESTNKEAAILLIKRQKSKKDYYSELERVINKFQLPITVFLIEGT